MNTPTLLAPCPSCARHVRATDPRCPFCDGALEASALYVPLPGGEPGARLGRAALYALGAAATLVSLAGCNTIDHMAHPDHAEVHSTNDIYGGAPVPHYGGPPVHHENVGVPAYGGPPPFDPQQTTTIYGGPPEMPDATAPADASTAPHPPRRRR